MKKPNLIIHCSGERVMGAFLPRPRVDLAEVDTQDGTALDHPVRGFREEVYLYLDLVLPQIPIFSPFSRFH